jgi:hypothetical protein
MDRPQASTEILDICKQIALHMMKIHPATRALGDDATQATILKSCHELTVALESIKKAVIRLDRRDDSTEL